MSQHLSRYWFGALRQKTNTWINVDPDLSRHVESLGHNDLFIVEKTYSNLNYSFITVTDQFTLYCIAFNG